ncbi:hypothetical protein [Streptomyces sp. NPDC051219]|uniref:Mu transposase domain-containing protein n=1 Tax=Streptomyces sp. NPDC051219 TaxID=3155283 RepID=UPI0034210C68
MDERRRTVDGARTTVAELAQSEPLLGLPALPFPAELSVERTVTAQSLVPFEGNFYSVPPGLPGARVTVVRRLGEDFLNIVTAGRSQTRPPARSITPNYRRTRPVGARGDTELPALPAARHDRRSAGNP